MPDTDTTLPEAQRKKSPVNRFVGYLYSLADRDDGTARAALAELRRAGADTNHRPRALAIVGDRIPDEVRGWPLDAYLLAAELLALYAAGGGPMPDRSALPKGRTSLGASARHVNPRKLNADGDYVDSQPGIGTRFSALLALPAEDLPDELRRFMRLLRSKDAPVDFYRLLHDLLRWNYFDQPTQKLWARHYWAAAPAPDSDDSSDT